MWKVFLLGLKRKKVEGFLDIQLMYCGQVPDTCLETPIHTHPDSVCGYSLRSLEQRLDQVLAEGDSGQSLGVIIIELLMSNGYLRIWKSYWKHYIRCSNARDLMGGLYLAEAQDHLTQIRVKNDLKMHELGNIQEVRNLLIEVGEWLCVSVRGSPTRIPNQAPKPLEIDREELISGERWTRRLPRAERKGVLIILTQIMAAMKTHQPQIALFWIRLAVKQHIQQPKAKMSGVQMSSVQMSSVQMSSVQMSALQIIWEWLELVAEEKFRPFVELYRRIERRWHQSQNIECRTLLIFGAVLIVFYEPKIVPVQLCQPSIILGVAKVNLWTPQTRKSVLRRLMSTGT